MPKITVLMPVFNGEAYVGEAIASILEQSYPNFELLIVEDGSQDGSLATIAGFTDRRIKLIRHGENKGLVASLNEGLAAASGEYIARMDADDISHPERLKVQLDYMERNPRIDVCGARVRLLGTDTVWGEALSAEETRCRLLFRCSLIHPTVMIRRRSLQKTGIRYEEAFRHAEDYRMWAELSRHSALVNLPDILLAYRLHEHQVSRQYHDEQIANAKRVQRDLLARLGLDPTPDELEAHWCIGLQPNRSHPARDAWIQKLLRANGQSPVYSPYVLARMLAESYQ